MNIFRSKLHLRCLTGFYRETYVIKGVSSGGFTNRPLFWNVSVTFTDPMLSINLEYFILNEMQNSLNIQSRRNQTFTDDDSF